MVKKYIYSKLPRIPDEVFLHFPEKGSSGVPHSFPGVEGVWN